VIERPSEGEREQKRGKDLVVFRCGARTRSQARAALSECVSLPLSLSHLSLSLFVVCVCVAGRCCAVQSQDTFQCGLYRMADSDNKLLNRLSRFIAVRCSIATSTRRSSLLTLTRSRAP